MQTLLKIFLLLVSIGFLTAVFGLIWMDWKITSTLPFLIVSMLLGLQTLTILFNQINFWRSVLLIFLGLQLICCNLYYFEIAPLYLLWTYMFSVLFIALVVCSNNLIVVNVGWFRWMKTSLMVFAIAGFLLSDHFKMAYTISLFSLITGLVLLLIGFFLQPRYSTKVPKP